MSDTLPILQAGPSFEPRRETVPVPELGGQVIVRGLMAAEAFALSARRAQALRTIREARAEHEARVRELRSAHDDRVANLPSGAKAPEFEAPEFRAPELGFDDLVLYGRYSSDLLARAVVVPSGLGLYTAEQWEVVGQHHPAMVERLRAVAERLSGLGAEDVEKNSSASRS